ncbi:MAG: Asp-tRNA(Asn)/Glu-tRNA(Gln) amidotransferase subunit GatB [Anaerolineales bacterium]
MQYEAVIGLEVHAELLTRSKMFCGCAVVDSTQAPPNTVVCPVCAGLPGTLPVINARAVEYGLRVALALGCRIPPLNVFARKNYFYPDIPKGYQISQYELPLGLAGVLEVETASGPRPVRIRRVHLEEDTGKLFHHEAHGPEDSPHSLVDLNRAGVPLLEIVTEPDLHTAEDVRAYGVQLRAVLRYLGVTSGDMEKGVIRFEPNISVRPAGSSELRTRTELKNLNSFRALERGTQYEIERRYFPEPDLPPLAPAAEWVEALRAALPELPAARRARLMAEYGLSAYDAQVLVEEPALAAFFEAAVAAQAAAQRNPKAVANWMTGELFRLMNDTGQTIEQAALRPAHLAELVAVVAEGTLNLGTAKTVFESMYRTGRAPAEIVAEQGLAQVSDAGEIESLVEDVIAAHPGELASYLAGKATLQQWFFGQVMRRSRGRGNPQIIGAALAAALARRQPAAPEH